MRPFNRSAKTRKGHSPHADDPCGVVGIDAFCAGLDLTSQLDEVRIEELAAGLAAEARASAPSNQHEAESGRPVPHLIPRWRRRMLLASLLSTLAVKIALASVALATATVGLAATGSLPDPAQQVVSDVASRVGITLPAPASDPAGTGGDGAGPELPDESSQTARSVIDVIFGDSDRDADFGKRVAETASDGRSGVGGRGNPEPPDESPLGPPDGLPQGPPPELPAGPPSEPPASPPAP